MLTYLEAPPGKEFPTCRGRRTSPPPTRHHALPFPHELLDTPRLWSKEMEGKRAMSLVVRNLLWKLETPEKFLKFPLVWVPLPELLICLGSAWAVGVLMCCQVENHCSRKAVGGKRSLCHQGVGSHSHVGRTACAEV